MDLNIVKTVLLEVSHVILRREYTSIQQARKQIDSDGNQFRLGRFDMDTGDDYIYDSSLKYEDPLPGEMMFEVKDLQNVRLVYGIENGDAIDEWRRFHMSHAKGG